MFSALKNNKIIKKIPYGLIILLFIFSTLPTAFFSSTVFAQESPPVCDIPFYSANDVLFFNPCEETCSVGKVSVTTTTDIAETEDIKTIYTYLTATPLSTNGNKPLTPTQAAGVMGNLYAESTFRPDAIEDTSRAEKGHGLAQWTFGRWNNLSNFASEQGKPWQDLTLQLDFLKSELEGSEQKVLNDSEFATTADPAAAAVRWRVVFERADPDLAHDDKRQGAAVSIYNMFGGASAECKDTSSAVAGDFVKTAINYALESPASDGMTSKSQARGTYQTAKEEFNLLVDWTDCGGFIATALIASGVDKNYPKVSVSAQLGYVRTHLDKYTVTNKPALSDLLPGDILYVDGHTTLYTGESQYPMVDASLGQRVPSVRTSASLQWMLSQSDLVSARLIK